MKKSSYKRLWIFGPSLCLPWLMEDPAQGWPELLAKELNIPEVINLATGAIDNFYIYQSIRQHLSEINEDDLLIIGWSHPNRKTFVLDRNNPTHLSALKTSLYFKDGDMEFMRSDNPTPDDGKKWSFLKPTSFGNKFYDPWFKDYFSEYEQNINFQSYYDSVKLVSPCKYVPIFFSKESTSQITVDPTLFYLDFVVDNNCNLSETDFHLNVEGHKLFTQSLLQFTKK